MLVCVCKGITCRDIDNALQEGATNYRDVRKSLGLGTGCGQCSSFAKEMVSEKITELQSVAAYHLGYEIRV